MLLVLAIKHCNVFACVVHGWMLHAGGFKAWQDADSCQLMCTHSLQIRQLCTHEQQQHFLKLTLARGGELWHY
jgi:hypothetical protein